ncbi:MAG: aminotransferase class V-fold PLP-dependent enzyme [Lachnospiraceae bacterium]|nr:aminotransferase class V-fold PLP-dependent enzyme [Lachnospiraceae bacterium]
MIYFDNAATTKLNAEVLEEMMPYLTEEFGNPCAIYSLGSHAKKALATARRRVAAVIGADPSEITFTSGGSESDNLAIFSAVKCMQDRGKHVITTKIEHHAVLNACKELEKQGYQVTYVGVNEQGRIEPAEVQKVIRPDTV